MTVPTPTSSLPYASSSLRHRYRRPLRYLTILLLATTLGWYAYEIRAFFLRRYLTVELHYLQSRLSQAKLPAWRYQPSFQAANTDPADDLYKRFKNDIDRLSNLASEPIVPLSEFFKLPAGSRIAIAPSMVLFAQRLTEIDHFTVVSISRYDVTVEIFSPGSLLSPPKSDAAQIIPGFASQSAAHGPATLSAGHLSTSYRPKTSALVFSVKNGQPDWPLYLFIHPDGVIDVLRD